MNEQELIKLVEKAAHKDNGAMEQLYNTYYADVLFVCKKYDLNDADAEDMAQDTFIKAFNEIGTLNDGTKFPAWISRIASNKCLNLIKHNKILNIDSMDNEDEAMEVPDKQKSTDEIVVDKEVRDILADMITKLPIEQRVTIFMYYYQDYSVKEIAKAYGCSEGTVKSRLNYARKAMRQEAEKLENKGVKLRVVAVLPFLYMFFASERQVFACEIPDCASVIGKVMGMSATAGNVSASTAVSSAVKTGFFATVGGKIAIGVAALAVVAGGVITAVALSDKSDRMDSDKGNDAFAGVFGDNLTDSQNKTDGNEEVTDDNNKPLPDDILEEKYDYNISYINEEGIDRGEFVFGLWNPSIMFSYSGCIPGDECIMGTYKNEDVLGQDFITFTPSYPETPYFDWDGSMDIIDNVNGEGVRVMVERLESIGKENAEEYAKVMDDYFEEEEKYYHGDYFICILRGNINSCYGYKYFDKNTIIKITMFINEGDENYKEKFETLLDRLSFEHVGSETDISGTDKCFVFDAFSKHMMDKYGLCLKTYSYIDEADPNRIIYETEYCEYEIEAEYNDMDLSPDSDYTSESLVKLGEFEDGVRVYVLRPGESNYEFIVVKDSEYISIAMDCDIPDENVDELFEMLRQDLLK